MNRDPVEAGLADGVSADSAPAEFEPWTISGAFAHAVGRWPDRPFLEGNSRCLTYEESCRDVAGLAAALVRLGAAPGDRVLVALGNRPEAVLTWLAADVVGAVVVPAPVEAGEERIRAIAADCGPRLAVVEREVLERCLGLDWSGGPATVCTPEDLQPGSSYASLPRPEERPGAVALIEYEPRLAGVPRGCLITQGQITHTAEQMLELTARSEDEPYWCALPAIGAEALATVVVPSILLGAAVSIAQRVATIDIWPEIHRTGARLAALTNRMMTAAALRSETREELCCRGQLRAVTGACPPADLQDLWSARFGVEAPGLPYYWRPEAGVLASVDCGAYSPAGSAGRRHPHYDVRILAGDDDELPPGEVGEIVCRPRLPHTMFRGYWNQPEATVAATANLWFHTGDPGRFDADGFLYLEGGRRSGPAPGSPVAAPTRLRRVPDSGRAG